MSDTKLPIKKLEDSTSKFYPLSVADSVVMSNDFTVTKDGSRYQSGDVVNKGTNLDFILKKIINGSVGNIDFELDEESDNPVANRTLTPILNKIETDIADLKISPDDSDGITIGKDTDTEEGFDGIVIGSGAISHPGIQHQKSVTIGTGAETNTSEHINNKGVALGYHAKTTSYNGVAIGFGAVAGAKAVAIGTSDDDEGEEISDTAFASTYSVAIGSCRAESEKSVAIGRSSMCANGELDVPKIAIGYGLRATDSKQTIIGNCIDPTKIYFGSASLVQLVVSAIKNMNDEQKAQVKSALGIR